LFDKKISTSKASLPNHQVKIFRNINLLIIGNGKGKV